MRDDLEKTYTMYLQQDDVFCDPFLKNILILSEETSISTSVQELLASWGCTAAYIAPISQPISPGPYFFSSRGLFSAWRLFPDDKDAFVLSTIPSQLDSHT